MELMLSLLFTLSILFLFTNHPLSMGLILLTQTIIISLICGLMNMNFWFSYILFLVMIGGMLVLFIYMTSIASNEKFKYSNNMMITSMILTTMIFILFLINEPFNFQFEFTNLDSLQMNTKPIFFMTLSKYISYPMMMISIMLMLYLLITLIAVVKITTIKYGPLRQKF